MCSCTALLLSCDWQEMLLDQRGCSFSSSCLLLLTDITCGTGVVSPAGFIVSIYQDKCSTAEEQSGAKPPQNTRLFNISQSGAALMPLFDSLSSTEVGQQSQPVFSAHSDTHLSPFAPSKNRGHLSSMGTAPHFFPPLATFPVLLLHHQIQHFYGKPQSF